MHCFVIICVLSLYLRCYSLCFPFMICFGISFMFSEFSPPPPPFEERDWVRYNLKYGIVFWGRSGSIDSKQQLATKTLLIRTEGNAFCVVEEQTELDICPYGKGMGFPLLDIRRLISLESMLYVWLVAHVQHRAGINTKISECQHSESGPCWREQS